MTTSFNAQQQAIIDITQGKHIVLAPPGCGKTHILAERIAKALRRGILPKDMLCLTFTNRAARGMRNRIAQMGCDMGEDLFVGNIHRYCSSLLFNHSLISSQSAIVDETDISDILEQICRHSCKNYAGNHFVPNYQHFMMQLQLDIDNDLLLHIASLPYKLELKQLCIQLGLPYCRKSLLHIYNHLNELPQQVEKAYDGLILTLKFARAYENYKSEHNILDFDDILILAYTFLRDKPHQKYTWIQIDEVQDLSPMQLEIVSLLYEAESPLASMLYLGDEQQAIFSFIGAKLSTLNALKAECRDGVHRLSHNYRAPKHLLQLYNDFAEKQLGVNPEFLPTTDFELTEDTTHYLRICYSETSENELANIAEHIVPSLLDNKDETTAIIVPTNQDADQMSRLLTSTPHFKISGQDVFTTMDMKALLAHFNVVKNENNVLAWSHIFRALHVKPSYAQSRDFSKLLFDARILPSDLLCFDNDTYLAHFCSTYQDATIVVYDTETTGTDVYNDDIVQLAAFKMRRGQKVPGSDFEVLLYTDKPLPPMLGDLVNPLVEVYNTRPHMPRKQGLASFIDYAEGCVLCGHNIMFDNNILHHNLERTNLNHSLPLLPTHGTRQHFSGVIDTLKLARMLFPGLTSFKLKDLLATLHLGGQNSHLANDDIEATAHLLRYCYEAAQAYRHKQLEVLNDPATKKAAQKFCQNYVVAYFHTLQQLYPLGNEPTTSLPDEMAFIAKELNIKPEKFDYILNFLREDVVDTQLHPTLLQQLSRYLTDLNTYRETDLCESESMKRSAENLFITTVHKAKGLEFDNVIVTGAVEGNYPFFRSKTVEEQMEDARKFYVAISRAKKRLFICHYGIQTMIDRNGFARTFARNVSPFCKYIVNHLLPLRF